MKKIKMIYNEFWTEDRGEFGSYIRNLNLPGLFKSGESVLDVGCGDGVVGDFLKGSLPDTEWTGLTLWEWSHIRCTFGFEKITKVLGVSERRLDKPFLKINPSLFGMILILEVK